MDEGEVVEELREADMLEEADNARKAARENPTELQLLREQLQGLAAQNTQTMQDNGLSLGQDPFQAGVNQMKVQMQVLIALACEEEEDRVLFEIACQEMIKRDLDRAVEEMEAQRARAALTDGIDLSGGMDLSALRAKTAGMPRAERREAARRLARDITSGGAGGTGGAGGAGGASGR